MNFRERKEYIEWRQEVIRVFGENCIQCGHAGNIHIHHILPVETYPELAFDANNGVPLCGNCHAEVTGQELEYADQLKELQKQFLGISPSTAPTIDELRLAAEADPSNYDAVSEYFSNEGDFQKFVDFYIRHQKAIPKNSYIISLTSQRLCKVGRHSDAIKFADIALKLVRKEGEVYNPALLSLIAHSKVDALEALGKIDEAKEYLKTLLDEFPDNAHLHRNFSSVLWRASDEEKDHPMLSLIHAIKAVGLYPENQVPGYLGWASMLCRSSGRLKDAMDFAKKQFACAKDNEDRIDALEKPMFTI